MREYQTRSERVLDTALSNAQVPERLLTAMRYSTLGGGKRFRALLVYAAGLAVGAPIKRLDAVAAALECVHAYSLIHDDLPAMDDDTLRRGKATNHIEFDQATAILAGDALQTLAFELINCPESGLDDAQCRVVSHDLAKAAGQTGMVGGQMLDILATNASDIDRTHLEDLHRRKTGALISAAVCCGANCSNKVSAKQQQSLQNYANNLGLAYQVVDDILDIEASTEQLGKNSGVDQALGKATYPALIGLQQSKQLAENLYQDAIASIASIGDNTALLADLAALVVNRQN